MANVEGAAPFLPDSVRGRVVALAGAVSFLLLIASLKWAHHWGLVADTLVFAWAMTTLFTVVMGVWTLRSRRP